MNSEPQELRQAALFWLSEPDPARKAEGVRLLAQAWQSGEVMLDMQAALSAQSPIPGQPLKPELVSPRMVKHRSMNTLEGRRPFFPSFVGLGSYPPTPTPTRGAPHPRRGPPAGAPPPSQPPGGGPPLFPLWVGPKGPPPHPREKRGRDPPGC